MMSKLEELISLIDADIGWRKKELSNIMLMHNDDNSKLMIKTLILFVYSHWEGCIKNICTLYLEYVSNQSVNVSKLTDNFKAIFLKGRISEMINSSETLTLSNELSFMKSLEESFEKKFHIKKKEKVDTKNKSILNTQSNLKYKVFESFLEIVGVGRRDCLSTKEAYIDEKLLQNRNKIAHGNKVDDREYNEIDLDIETIKKIKTLVFSIIDFLSNDIKYYAENEFYLACKTEERNNYNQNSNKLLEQILKEIGL